MRDHGKSDPHIDAQKLAVASDSVTGHMKILTLSQSKSLAVVMKVTYKYVSTVLLPICISCCFSYFSLLVLIDHFVRFPLCSLLALIDHLRYIDLTTCMCAVICSVAKHGRAITEVFEQLDLLRLCAAPDVPAASSYNTYDIVEQVLEVLCLFTVMRASIKSCVVVAFRSSQIKFRIVCGTK